jgi:hypothetical protein
MTILELILIIVVFGIIFIAPIFYISWSRKRSRKIAEEVISKDHLDGFYIYLDTLDEKNSLPIKATLSITSGGLEIASTNGESINISEGDIVELNPTLKFSFRFKDLLMNKDGVLPSYLLRIESKTNKTIIFSPTDFTALAKYYKWSLLPMRPAMVASFKNSVDEQKMFQIYKNFYEKLVMRFPGVAKDVGIDSVAMKRFIGSAIPGLLAVLFIFTLIFISYALFS